MNWKNASLCVKVGRSSVELHCCCSPGCRVEMFLWHFTGRYEKQSLATFQTGLAFSPQYCPAESRKICIPQNCFHLKLHLGLQKCLFNTTDIILTTLIKEVQVLEQFLQTEVLPSHSGGRMGLGHASQSFSSKHVPGSQESCFFYYY